MREPIRYGVLKELFKLLGVNPYDFRVVSGENVSGYWPNMPGRQSTVSVDRLATVIWEGSDV